MQEPSIGTSWDRLALALCAAELQHRDEWREHFRTALADFRFLPGENLLANAGTSRSATLMDCLAAGSMEDSLQGIFNSLREGMVSLQWGGHLGVDFSTLRPAGVSAQATGGTASGPVSFMQVWETACAVRESGNPRAGTVMACLRCDHPDIEAFIAAKTSALPNTTAGGDPLPHFSLTVCVTDDFMRAVEQDGPWPLVFPVGKHAIPAGGEVCERVWPGAMTPQLCQVHRRIPARALWDKLLQAQHACGQPAVAFIDRINRDNNLWYCEHLSTMASGGGLALPAGGACAMGYVNLSRFVQGPFSTHPRLDFAGLRAVTRVAVRFLDNAHDISVFALRAQEKMDHASRRIGLGVTGLADMFAMLGLRYGSAGSFELAHQVMVAIRDTAYSTSVALAQEKGPFPEFDKTRFGASSVVLGLPRHLQDAIAQHGLRNSHLLAVGDADPVSLLAHQVSSGIDPIFSLQAMRRVRGADGQWLTFPTENAAWHQYRQLHGAQAPVPDAFVVAHDVSAQSQLRMAATAQAYADNTVHRTVLLPRTANPQELGVVLLAAWEQGLKCCAARRAERRSGEAMIAALLADRRSAPVAVPGDAGLFANAG